MFTGIIEAVGSVQSARQTAGGIVLAVELGRLAEGAKTGDSIAVNGVCLTVSKIMGNNCEFDVSGETLGKSTLKKLHGGSVVNLERAMGTNGRFGGHFVLGHVDGKATISAIEKKGDFYEFRFKTGSQLLDEMVGKGSVAVDGISLTIADMNSSGFVVAIIPTTYQDTNLGKAKVGDEVNIETDIIVKTIKRQLDKMMPAKDGLTIEKLKEYGF